MIKNCCRILLALIIFSFSTPICNAEDEFVHQDLKQLYSDSVSKNLRKTFNNYLNRAKIESSEKISEEQLKLFGQKFIVFQIDHADLYKKDHYLISILINPANIEAWSVEMVKTRSGNYKIREIKNIAIKKKSMKDFKEYVTKEKLGYWQ